VSFRWLVKAGDLSHKLQRSRANLLGCCRRRKIKKVLDVPAHCNCSIYPLRNSGDCFQTLPSMHSNKPDCRTLPLTTPMQSISAMDTFRKASEGTTRASI